MPHFFPNEGRKRFRFLEASKKLTAGRKRHSDQGYKEVRGGASGTIMAWEKIQPREGAGGDTNKATSWNLSMEGLLQQLGKQRAKFSHKPTRRHRYAGEGEKATNKIA